MDGVIGGRGYEVDDILFFFPMFVALQLVHIVLLNGGSYRDDSAGRFFSLTALGRICLECTPIRHRQYLHVIHYITLLFLSCLIDLTEIEDTQCQCHWKELTQGRRSPLVV